MAKKNEIRVICVSREAFFSLIETFVYDKIRGLEPPEGYHGIIPGDFRDVFWNCARFVSGAALDKADEIILNYQNDTISRLHNLGYSYRVLDRRGDGSAEQMSLFENQTPIEEQEEEETKITIITHNSGQTEVNGEVPGGVEPFALLMGIHAHVDCIATYLKQPKQKIIAHLMLLCQTIDANPDKINRKSVEINLPKK